jgi:hypothetical protein
MRGDIFEWFKTDLTDRKQKVVLNNTESEIGCLYAGFPQGSILVTILFLIYINDIADHTDGICRLFADDTSLEHSSNDLQNLQDMINSDLSNIKKWSENWLITFNPDKTDIMLFDSIRQGNRTFKFGQTNILSVDFHKHLGIVFSSDDKWTRGYGFLFLSEFFFRTTQEVEYLFFSSREAQNLFPEFNIRLYDKNSESDYFFFPSPKSEYFFQQHWES